MKRPTIKSHFAEKATLTQVHHEYTQSPHLYSYVSKLDRYVDWLKDKLSERESEIELLNKQLLEKSLPTKCL